MNILHVNMSVDPVLGGGSVERVCKLHIALQKLNGVHSRVLSTNAGLRGLPPFPSEQLLLLPCLSERWYLPAPRLRALSQAIAWADIVHMMNHWTVLNVWAYWFARMHAKPYVICPAGSLLVFGRSSPQKRFYNAIIGNRIIRNASAGIAITEDEFDHFSQYEVPQSNVFHIPNGVSKEDFGCNDARLFRQHFGLGDVPYILFVGRLNPIKGPDLLLQAFAELSTQFPEYHLVMVGPDGGLREALLEMAAGAGLQERVHLVGFAGGDLKSSAYHGADMLVVPSRQEAMSIVALEAGITSTPVILTDQCGFPSLAEAGGALITSADTNGLIQGVSSLLQSRKLRDEMGRRAASFIEDNYTWEIAAKKHVQLFHSLL